MDKQERFGIGTIHTAHDGQYEVIGKPEWYSRRIRFLATGYEVEVPYPALVVGSVKDRLHRSVLGIGYIGEEDFSDHPEFARIRNRWNSMIRYRVKKNLKIAEEDRCFAEYFKRQVGI